MSGDGGFKINSDYAKKYNMWREKEELQRLKDKYGDEAVEESSTSESEDEEGEAFTAKQEKNWLRTLSALKARDPKIYDKNVDFFKEESDSDSETEDESTSESEEKKPKVKPMFLKDYEREVILKKGGVIESDDSEAEDDKEYEARSRPGYFEEQEQIKESFKPAVESDNSEEEEGEEGLFVKRKKTSEEKQKEDGEYFEWLKGQKDELPEEDKIGVELNPLKDYWSNPKLDSGEKFLKDYILNKRYVEEDDVTPSYDDVVGIDDDEEFSDEEELLEKQETFERKYNFRYEEPDEEFIKSYPRTIGGSVRQKDPKRAVKRQEVKDRKQAEKEKKKEELNQLKNLKRKQIMNKIDKLKEITGNSTLGFTEVDIDDDFDPKKHDEMMQKAFSADYYDMDVDVDGKPVFSDGDDEGDLEKEDWDKWAGPEEDYEPDCEDPDFNMDADFDPSEPAQPRRVAPQTSSKKKRSKFAQAVEKKKPAFDPNEKTFEEYFDEYYKLDYEDIIDDIPCRFKYRQVQSNDFGLSTEEMLSAKDKELNAWVSLKKMVMYRTEEEEMFDKRIYQKKGRNQKKKLNIMPSLAGPVASTSHQSEDEEEGEEEDEDVYQSAEEEETTAPAVPQPSASTTPTAKQQKKRRKKKKKKGNKPVVAASGPTASKPSPSSSKPGPTGSKPGPSASKSGPTGFRPSPAASKRSPGAAQNNNSNKQKGKRPLESNDTHVKGFKKTKLDVQSTVSNKQSANAKTGKKRPRKGKGKNSNMSDERLKAYGINPKKFKYSQANSTKE